MTIGIIGKKEKKHRVLKENSFQFGDLVMRKRRNMLHLFHGIQSTKIFLPFLLVAMTFQNKKLDKFSSGHLKMLLSLSINTKVYQPELCALTGILLHLLCWQLVFMMEQFWSTMSEINIINPFMNQM